jgi:hypothetical protein
MNSFTLTFTNVDVSRMNFPATIKADWNLAVSALTPEQVSSYSNPVVAATEDSFVYTQGHKWRRWVFKDTDDKILDVAFRERQGLKQALAATPKTREGYEAVLQMDFARFLSHHLFRTTTPVAARSVVSVQAGEWSMRPRKVAYIGFRGETQMTRMFGRIEMVYPTLIVSPVQTEETTTRIVVNDRHACPVSDYAHLRDGAEKVHYVDTNGTTLFTQRDISRDDATALTQWDAMCETATVAEMNYRFWNNGTETPSASASRVYPEIVLSDLRTHAAQTPLEVGVLEALREERRALKEALAMAVFRPDRVERMMETYGEDWMERV